MFVFPKIIQDVVTVILDIIIVLAGILGLYAIITSPNPNDIEAYRKSPRKRS